MRFPRVPQALVAALALVPAWGQTTISLDSVIGAAGTDAYSVRGAGNAVNQTGVASSGGTTTVLTASGSSGSSSFNFQSGFGDNLNRATGSSPGSGAFHIYADRAFDSSSPFALVLDKNNNGSYGDEVDSAPGDANTFHFGPVCMRTVLLRSTWP